MTPSKKEITAALAQAEAEIDAGLFATQDQGERLQYFSAIAEGRAQLKRVEGISHDEVKRQILAQLGKTSSP